MPVGGFSAAIASSAANWALSAQNAAENKAGPGQVASRAVGSSGSKRTRQGEARRHLPKVGTPANEAWERHEGIEHMEHPFADDPSVRRGPWAAVIAVIVIVALLAGLVGWLFIT